MKAILVVAGTAALMLHMVLLAETFAFPGKNKGFILMVIGYLTIVDVYCILSQIGVVLGR